MITHMKQDIRYEIIGIIIFGVIVVIYIIIGYFSVSKDDNEDGLH